MNHRHKKDLKRLAPKRSMITPVLLFVVTTLQCHTPPAVAQMANTIAPGQSNISATAAADRATNSELQFLAAVNRADLSGYLAYFPDTPGIEMPSNTVLLSKPFFGRFVDRTEDLSPESGNAFVDRLVTAYREYWVQSLTAPGSVAEHNQALIETLQQLAHDQQSEKAEALDGVRTDLPGQLNELTRANGFELKMSTTPPLMDLYVWRTTRTDEYRVALTDGQEHVAVHFMDDMISQGWTEFASLGLLTTSGWTDDGGLYCVDGTYDLGTENFRVSYLKHEARHFADFRRFPGLDDVRLEYRAKLTELAFSGYAASDILRKFANDGEIDGPTAHARANYRVAHDIYREIFDQEMPRHLDPWTIIGPDRINPAARQLLDEDTAKLVAAGLGASSNSR